MLITAVITVAWAVAFIVLLIARSSLPAWDTRWIWTCAAGVGLGVFALAYVPRVKRSRARAAARRRAEQAAGGTAAGGTAAGGTADIGPE